MKNRLIYLMVLSAIVFTSLEAILWRFFPLPLEIGEQIVHHNIQTLPGVKKEVLFKKNIYGFRSLSMNSKTKDDKTIRVIAIGASTTQQSSQNIEDSTYGIVDMMLNKELKGTGYKVEVAAWGKGALYVWQGYEYCVEHLYQFQPDIVVLLWGVNNVSFKGSKDYFYEGKAARMYQIMNKERSLSSRLRMLLRSHSQIYRRFSYLKWQSSYRENVRLKKVLDWHSKSIPGLRLLRKQRPYRENPIRIHDPSIEFHDGMEAILENLRDHKVKPIVLGQPVFWKPIMTEKEDSALWFHIDSEEGYVRASTRWLYEEMSRYNEIQKDLAERFNAPYVDLDSVVPKTLDNYIDDCHFTDMGARQVAISIYPTILESVKKIIAEKKAVRTTPNS